MHRHASLVLVVALVVTAGCSKQRKDSAPTDTSQADTHASAGAEVAATAADTADGAMTAEDIVAKAVEAAGGVERLSEKLSNYTITSAGTYFGQPFTMTTSSNDYGEVFMSINDGAMVMAYLADECWIKQGELVVPCLPAEAKASKAVRFSSRLSHLYPLALDDQLVIEVAEPVKLGAVELIGVTVSKPDGPCPVGLYFDPTHWVLRKMTFTQPMADGATTKVEILFLGYKKTERIKLPYKSTMRANGMIVMDETITSYELGTVDPALFVKPAQAPMLTVGERSVPMTTVVMTTHLGPYESIGGTIGGLYAWAGSHGAEPNGPVTMRYTKDPTSGVPPAEYVTELRLPVKALPTVPAADKTFVGAAIPAHTELYLYATGAPDEVASHFGLLTTYAEAHGYTVTGPPAMTSYTDPASTPPAEQIHALHITVTKQQ